GKFPSVLKVIILFSAWPLHLDFWKCNLKLFYIGKNCPIKKRNITTHNWYKLELQYASLYSIVISKTDGLNLYIRMLMPPLMYSMIRKEDEEDYVPFYEIDNTTSWFRAVDLYENCPSYLKKEFSMNTILKLDFKSEDYDFLFQLLTYCKSIQIFFAPITMIKGELPPTVVQFQLNDFECFYALQCILTGSFEISDQLIFWKEVEKVKVFLQEKCKENPHALSRSLYQIFEAIIKGNVVNFYDCLRYLYESFWKQEPKAVIDDFSSKKVKDSHLLLIKRCIVTPTHVVFLPPQPTLKSRALRDCEPDYSLRVSIKDVNMDSINYSAKSFGQNSAELQRNFFKKYYKNVLLRGLKIGKRNYKYVGSSTSQLKGHGLWYYAEDSKKKTADDLRREFGALDKIRQVPKYMARMGQTFSQSLGYIEVPQELTNVKEPDDDIEGGVKEYLTFKDPRPKSPKKFLKEEGESATDEEEEESTEPYNFSDGIGRISSELAEEVYKKLDVLDKKPSAMQIRYAGCKGMLVVDPRLERKTIRFRKSMKKFESDHNSLEILKFSEKRACFLNRPFITILEQLGVSKEMFLKLQKEMIQKHISSMFHEWEACHFLHRHALLRFDFLRMYTAGIRFTEDPLYRSMIYSLFQKQLGKSFEEHLSNLRRVFEKLKEAKLKLNPSKCNLFRHEVNYLGHIISADGVRTDPQKVSAVKDWRRPKNVHELRSFLGLCTYYRRFVKGFSSIARPLHRLTENKQKFLWTDECEEAFNSLKAALTSFPILVYPDPEKQFILDTDASHESVGAVLSQEINGQEHVIAYWSKCL
ncbi:RNA-dependent RNA polymerase 1, partial [Trichonephila clavata]